MKRFINRRSLLLIAAIVVVGLGALGVKLPEPVANVLQQAGVDVSSLRAGAGSSHSEPAAAAARVGAAAATAVGNNGVAGDFREAKRWLYSVHADHRLDFYCGCGFDQSRRNIDTSSCGYKVKEDRTRGGRIEAEHVIPASWLGQARACWRAPNCQDERGRPVQGRDCCLATDAEFVTAHNDLHNLQPTVGELNKHRGSYPFGEVRGEPRDYGRCDFEVTDSGRSRRVEPPENVRGDIARTAFYMRDRYGVELRGDQVAQFRQWNTADPVDDWERLRNQRIAKKQGISNSYVE